MNNSGRQIGLLAFGVLLWLMTSGSTVEAALDFSGSFRSELAIRRYETPDDSPIWKLGDKNTLRFNFKEVSPKVKLEGSFDLSLLAGDDADSFLKILPAGQDPSFLFLDTRWVPLFETRKLYLSLFFNRYTLTLGRQIINYGVGYVFSPIDCFSSVDLQDPGLSRKGSDIVRVQIPLGDLAGIEGVATIASMSTDSASAIKIFGNIKGYDWCLTGIYKKPQDEFVAGVTFKGDLLLGIHGELVEHYNTITGADYFEGMAGVDYSFDSGKLLLLAEYYYNGNPIDPGTLTPGELLALHRTFLGKDYLFCQANYIYDEIRSFTLNGLFNPVEGSWVGMIQFKWNIRQNTNLLLNTRYYTGDLNGMEVHNSPNVEYGVGVEVKF
jgi:hypothetical protein